MTSSITGSPNSHKSMSQPIKIDEQFFCAILSIIPGLGQLRNGHHLKGVIHLFAAGLNTIALLVCIALPHLNIFLSHLPPVQFGNALQPLISLSDQHVGTPFFYVLLAGSLLLVLYSMHDAGQNARVPIGGDIDWRTHKGLAFRELQNYGHNAIFEESTASYVLHVTALAVFLISGIVFGLYHKSERHNWLTYVVEQPKAPCKDKTVKRRGEHSSIDSGQHIAEDKNDHRDKSYRYIGSSSGVAHKSGRRVDSRTVLAEQDSILQPVIGSADLRGRNKSGETDAIRKSPALPKKLTEQLENLSGNLGSSSWRKATSNKAGASQIDGGSPARSKTRDLRRSAPCTVSIICPTPSTAVQMPVKSRSTNGDISPLSASLRPTFGGASVNPDINNKPDKPASLAAEADIDFGPYMADLQKRIRKAWFPPRANQYRRIVLEFKIHTEGAMTDLHVTKSSGFWECDQAAVIAVQNASPMHALPANSPKVVDIQFTFDYNRILVDHSGSSSSVPSSSPEEPPAEPYRKRKIGTGIPALPPKLSDKSSQSRQTGTSTSSGSNSKAPRPGGSVSQKPGTPPPSSSSKSPPRLENIWE